MSNPIEEYNEAMIGLARAVAKVADDNAEAMGRVVKGMEGIKELVDEVRVRSEKGQTIKAYCTNKEGTSLITSRRPIRQL